MIKAILTNVKKIKTKFILIIIGLGNYMCFYVDYLSASRSPQFLYQPIFKLKNAKRRQISTVQRWEAICNAVQDTKIERGAVLDIGCNMGFFTFSLAEEGFFCLGLDGDSEICQFNNKMAFRNKIAQKKQGGAVFTAFTLDKVSIDSLPSFDVILFLGVWHHITKTHTLDESKEILSKLYNKCNRIMIFESGDGPVVRYNIDAPTLHMKDKWFRDLLNECCPKSIIQNLGDFETRDAGSGKPDGETRPMYSVVKKIDQQ